MNTECPICLEDKELCITNCNHNFCFDCLHEWLKINQDCPNCRKKIESFKIGDEINKIIYINDHQNLNIDDINILLRNNINYRKLNIKLYLLLRIISFTSLLLMSSTVFLSINCYNDLE